MTGVEVKVAASTCGTYGNSYRKRVLNIACDPPLKGRFVTVSVKDTKLSLCEVEVMAVPVRKQGWLALLVLSNVNTFITNFDAR